MVMLGLQTGYKSNAWVTCLDLLVKIVDGGLHFYFLFSLYFIFRTTWVRVYQSCCHISHKLMV